MTPPDSTEPLRASAPSTAKEAALGPLAELTGTWTGKGFNLIALPVPEEAIKFRVMLNATLETFTFAEIGAPIPNRGNFQENIFFSGLHYMQKVNDATTNEGLHLEPGLWLNVPATTAPEAGPTVVRLSTIPHGDSLLAQGRGFAVKEGPQLGTSDSTPFTVNESGHRINDSNEKYLAPYTDAELPPGIPKAAILNPNVLLDKAIEGQKIVNTVVLDVHASPVGGINGSPVTPGPSDVGGIVNIPFVVRNANANSMSSIFWIETVENPDGTQFLQLQYSQTVILDFPVPGPDGNLVDIKWPHITVATLIKN